MESKNLPTYDGPVWAAILAAAIGCASFGVLVDLAEASKAVSNSLNFYSPTGDLSGKSTIAIGLWLVVWMVLHVVWKDRNLSSPRLLMRVSTILVLSALAMTFPPFINLFG